MAIFKVTIYIAIFIVFSIIIIIIFTIIIFLFLHHSYYKLVLYSVGSPVCGLPP